MQRNVNLSLGIHICPFIINKPLLLSILMSLFFRFLPLLVPSNFNVWTLRLSTSSYLCDPFHSNYWYWIFIEYFRKWMEFWYFLLVSSFCIRFIYWLYLLPGIKPVLIEYNAESSDFQMSTVIRNHGLISASLVTFASPDYDVAAGWSRHIR